MLVLHIFNFKQYIYIYTHCKKVGYNSSKNEGTNHVCIPVP